MNESSALYAFMNASWARSCASSGFPVICRANASALGMYFFTRAPNASWSPFLEASTSSSSLNTLELAGTASFLFIVKTGPKANTGQRKS